MITRLRRWPERRVRGEGDRVKESAVTDFHHAMQWLRDEAERDGMVSDIEEMDRIIGQFLDFARGDLVLEGVGVEAVDALAAARRARSPQVRRRGWRSVGLRACARRGVRVLPAGAGA